MLELLEKVGQSAAKFRILPTLWEVPKNVQRLVRNNVGEKLRNGKNLRLKFMIDCVKTGYKNAKLVAQGKRNSCKEYKFKYLD